MRDNVQAESPEDYIRKLNNCTFSLLYAKWNENKVYRPTRQNRLGATVGSIYFWKYCSIVEALPRQRSLWIRLWQLHTWVQLRWEVRVCFVDIGGILMTINVYTFFSLCDNFGFMHISVGYHYKTNTNKLYKTWILLWKLTSSWFVLSLHQDSWYMMNMRHHLMPMFGEHVMLPLR